MYVIFYHLLYDIRKHKKSMPTYQTNFMVFILNTKQNGFNLYDYHSCFQFIIILYPSLKSKNKEYLRKTCYWDKNKKTKKLEMTFKS